MRTVPVISSGQIVDHVDESRARHMAAAPNITVRRRKGEIVGIIVAAAGRPKQPCTPASIKQYMGQKYTYRERLIEGDMIVGSVLQFRYINPLDRPIFLLSVTDCMPQKSTEYATTGTRLPYNASAGGEDTSGHPNKPGRCYAPSEAA